MGGEEINQRAQSRPDAVTSSSGLPGAHRRKVAAKLTPLSIKPKEAGTAAP